jgi:peptide/nickel transport system permease protein
MAGVLKTVPAEARASAGTGRILRAAAVRTAGAVAVLWGAVTATFLVLQIMPGDTVDVLLARSTVSPELRARLIAEYRLDEPLWTQYATYLEHLVRGDLGDSYALRRPVADVIGAQLPDTLALIAATLLLTVAGAVVLAVAGARRRPWARAVFGSFESLMAALPPFWLGLILLTVFSFTLHWFPAIGDSSPRGLVLPALALAAGPIAVLAQVLREGMLRALEEPFVLTARTRGISETAVRLRHVLRHALTPAVTLLGWITGSLIGGAVIVEIVFSRQGVGRLVLSAVQNRDMPVVTAVVLLSAVVFVTVNLVVDALNALIDPRTREAA